MKRYSFREYFPFILLYLLLSLNIACSDVLEADLEKEQVQLKAPANGLVSPQQVQLFWWEPISENIEGYRMEIVSPNFDSATTLIELTEFAPDDLTTYTTTLAPGTYEWTIFAYNSTSETAANVYRLTIQNDSILDLSNQAIQLLEPPADLETQDTSFTFRWGTLDGADSYRFQIAAPDFTFSSNILHDILMTTDQYELNLTEGEYIWRVRAENDQSVTLYSTRSLVVDQTAPVAPVLLSPANRDTVSLPVTLSWEVDESSVKDSLYIFPDSLQSAPVRIVETTDTNFSFDDSRANSYFWRVKSVDAAGNVSGFSGLRRFFVE